MPRVTFNDDVRVHLIPPEDRLNTYFLDAVRERMRKEAILESLRKKLDMISNEKVPGRPYTLNERVEQIMAANKRRDFMFEEESDDEQLLKESLSDLETIEEEEIGDDEEDSDSDDDEEDSDSGEEDECDFKIVFEDAATDL